MKVTSVGHAGLQLETAAGTILCDPWRYPAYYASWFVFPDNSVLDWDALGDCDYLYVSHLHHDHFDAENLVRHVDKSATVLLPDFPVDDLADALRELGFTKFEHIPNDTPVELDGMRVMISALTAPNDGPLGDSALAVDDGSAILLNQNDARPLGFDMLRAFAGDAGYDAHLLQFSGAIWWPMVYDLPAKTAARIGAEKRVNGMERSLRYATDIGAAYVFPSAGPPCFLDDDLFACNDVDRDPSNVFPDATVFLEFLAERGHDNGRLLIPGSTAEVLAADTSQGRDAATCTVTHPMPDDDVARIFTDKAEYLAEYQARQASRLAAEKAAWAAPDVDILAELRAWFEPLLALSVQFAEGIGYPVELAVVGDPDAPSGDPRGGDESVVIDFVDRVVRRPLDGERCRYRFRVARPLVERLIADHEIDWVNTLFLSLRFEAHRAGPYNEYLYTFFKCLVPERLEYAEGWYAEQRNDDSETVIDGWAMQARCPHLKAELAHFGVVDGTTLTCRMHGWQWDLTTGRCLTSRGHELRCHAIDEPADGAAACRDGSVEPGPHDAQIVAVPDAASTAAPDEDDVPDFAS
jgi:UDP-MurNAc hydroxylase